MSFSFPAIFRRPRLTGHRGLFLLCLFLFVLSGFFSFWVFFPARVLQHRLLQEVSRQTDLNMQGRHATKLFPPGLGLDLTIYPPVAGMTDIELTELQITPVWGSLFSENQKVHLEASLAGGALDAVAARDGQVNLEIRDLTLMTLQRPDLPFRVSGQLTGQFAGRNLSQNMDGQGSFSLFITDLRILGLARLGLPADLCAGMLQLEGKVLQRRISLEKIVLTGGVIELSGGGNILLGKTADQSRLNLNLRLYPTATTPDSLRDLFNLTGIRPTADGSYLFRVGGTVAKPSIR